MYNTHVTLCVCGRKPVFDLPERKSIHPIVTILSVFRSEYHFFTQIANFEHILIARRNCCYVVIPSLTT